MIKLGLTGCIGSGKSTVADFFREKGVPVIDADVVSRQAVIPGSTGWSKLVGCFGPEILLPDSNIDREKLGRYIFSDPAARAQLNNCLHPIIIAEILRRIDDLENSKSPPLLITDVPLLFECGMQKYFNYTLLVYADRKTVIRRLTKRDGITIEQAAARLDSQMGITTKKKLADFIIENCGSIPELRDGTNRLYEKLCGKQG